MIQLSQRLARVKPSPTNMLTAKVAELVAAGRDIIALGAGEPDFDTPAHVKNAGIRAIEGGHTKYTPIAGTLALRQAIARKFARENGLQYDPAREITVGCGGKNMLFSALMATLDPGDEVIIPAPYWVSYPDMTRLAEGTPVFVEAPETQGFLITPEQLEAAITPRTKWLILNSPNNPTGAAYSRTQLAALAEVLLRHPHVLVMADDIYEHLLYDAFEFVTIAHVEPALAPRVLTVNGVSKAYSMTGWRLGYAGGPKELIAAMNVMQSQSITHTSSITQAAAVEALNGPQDFLDERVEVFRQRRDLVVQRLNAIDGITCRKPQGAFYVYASCAGIMGRTTPAGNRINTDTEFVAYLLEAAGVACVPGSAFGLAPFFRIAYAVSTATLDDACNRIASAVSDLR